MSKRSVSFALACSLLLLCLCSCGGGTPKDAAVISIVNNTGRDIRSIMLEWNQDGDNPHFQAGEKDNGETPIEQGELMEFELLEEDLDGGKDLQLLISLYDTPFDMNMDAETDSIFLAKVNLAVELGKEYRISVFVDESGQPAAEVLNPA